MANYSGKTQPSNKHLANETSARFVHIDGSVTTPITVIPASSGGRLLRVILNTTGATLRLRSGSDVIGVISATATTGTYKYGVYVANGLIYEAGGALDATLVFAV